MSKTIKETVKEIQYKTDLTLDQIAVKAGYSPAYFRNEVSKDVSKSVLEALRTKFKDELTKLQDETEQNVFRETEVKYSIPIQDKYIQLLESNLKEKTDQLTELKARLDETIKREQDFLAKIESSLQRYEHLVLAQLQSKGASEESNTPVVEQRVYKTSGTSKKQSS